MDQLMRFLKAEQGTKRPPRQYAIAELVARTYGAYLTTYQPRKPKQRKKSTKNPLIGPFDSMAPYTITLMGYLGGEVDIDALYEALRHRVSGGDEPGSLDPVVSGEGRITAADQEGEGWTKKFLSNHTSIKMRLSGGLRVQIRVSTSKIEVIGCKKDSDIDEAWEHLSTHINGIEGEIRLDAEVQLELLSSYAAMRNYAFTLGYALDVRELAVGICELRDATGFEAWRNPSLQTDLRVHCATSRSAKNTPQHARVPSPVGESSSSCSSSSSRRTSAKKRPSPSEKAHIFRVFHTGRCLYSGKGGLDECGEVFERFRLLMDELRPRVELRTPVDVPRCSTAEGTRAPVAKKVLQ
jgi:hypothetical protein